MATKTVGVGKTLPLKPRMSEKTYALSQTGVYVFDVPGSVNKLQIEKAVESQFEVKVKRVRISILKGKDSRSIRIGARVRSNVSGKRVDVKKAYVTLNEGDSIPIFAALDEQQAKIDKAEEKIAKKTSKESVKKESKAVKPSSEKRSILGRRKQDKGGSK